MDTVTRLKRMVPRGIKDPIKKVMRQRELSACIRELRAVKDNVPPHETVLRLREAWGNTGFSADVDYLLEAVRLSRAAKGNVVECGSGLSTVLLSSLGIFVYSLEHDIEWADSLRSFLSEQHLTAEILRAPLASYGDYSWYQIPSSLTDIALMLCDGPPGKTPGGRYGLMPQVAQKMAHGFTVLMDDAERPEEAEIAKRWAGEYDLALEFLNNDSGTLAVLRKK